MINTSKKLLNAIRHSELSGDELNGSAHRSIEATQEEIIQMVQKVQSKKFFKYDDLYRILSDEDAIEHFKTEPVVTHELHEGACLRYTEHGTVNIDIDVSDPATKKTIGYNVKSLKVSRE